MVRLKQRLFFRSRAAVSIWSPTKQGVGTGRASHPKKKHINEHKKFGHMLIGLDQRNENGTEIENSKYGTASLSFSSEINSFGYSESSQFGHRSEEVCWEESTVGTFMSGYTIY